MKAKELIWDFEKIYPNGLTIPKRVKNIISNDMSYIRWKYIKAMRISNSLKYNKNIINNVRKLFFDRKRNRLGLKLGYEIYSNRIGSGICIYHNGPIVIHKNAVIGDNCELHGDNCIGNDGKTDKCPIIGDNVKIGVGAKIIGDVKIADGVTIGAGAVVVNDLSIKGSTAVGVPAKIIKR